MGILTSNDGVSDYMFIGCEFSENGYGDGYSHNIYVGHANSLTMWNCYSHDSHIGHLVKSRANINSLYYNRITGENGDGSYEIDLPNGGLALLLGNIIEQSPNSQNGGIISFGLEGPTNPEQVLILSNNTVVNDRFDGRFVQFSDQTTLVKMANNLFLGPGTLLQGATASLDTTHNIYHLNIADGLLTDPANFDYHPTVDAACVDAGITTVFYEGESLSPQFQYVHPLDLDARQTQGSAVDIGAYEFPAGVLSVDEAVSVSSFHISPNPSLDGRTNLIFNTPLRRPTLLQVFDFSGKMIFEKTVSQSENRLELQLGEIPKGAYLIDMEGFKKEIFVKN